MWRATLSSLASHKVRFALTTLAVVLGVAFISGTLIFVDTATSAFTDLFDDINANVDLSVRGVSRLDDLDGGSGAEGFGAAPPSVDPETVDRIAAVEGVAAVEPRVEGIAQMLDADGRPVGGQAPTIGIGAPTVAELTTFELRDGRYPSAPDEVLLDAETVEDQGLVVGDTVRVGAGGPVESYTLVGVGGFGGADTLAGASLTMFSPDRAFELFAVDGGYDGVDVLVADDADIDALRDAITAAVGDDYEVVTGDELAAEANETVDAIMGALSTGLLVFAGVSLLVGAFIISNTFAIVVVQRARELALLRAVGASRRQVLGSVMLEALAVGVIGSVVGVASGVGVAALLRAVLAAFSLELPATDLVFAARTALIGLGVGVGVTLLSAVAPAIKASRVAPVAAMQAIAVPPTGGRGRIRAAAGFVLLGAGAGLLALGLFADGGMTPVIGGALALLLGAALLARHVVRPLLGVLGWPVARLGIRGSLAQENALRNPRRTASTASALMVGLGLVVFAMIFGASLRTSTERTIAEQFASDLQIRSELFQPMPAAVQDEIERLPQVASVTDMRVGQVGVDGRVVSAVAVEPGKLATTWNLDVVDGDLDHFGRGGMVVADDAAEQIGITAGDTIEVTFPRTGAQSLDVQAIVDGETASYYIDEATFLEHMADDGPFTLYVSLADGVTVDEARPAIEEVTGRYAALAVQDAEDMREQISDQVNQVLGLVSALLALSILSALFGIANTLGLSVFERVREFGLLRAVGATRSQVRAMVRWESVLIAILGAVFGILIGTVFGWLAIRALADDGLSTFAFPALQVVAGVLGAGVAGVLAAIVPARRAARVDVLRAVAPE